VIHFKFQDPKHTSGITEARIRWVQIRFFSTGVMYAALNCVVNNPRDNDLLNSSVINGAMASTLSFKDALEVGRWRTACLGVCGWWR